jgi:hypothetical protein
MSKSNVNQTPKPLVSTTVRITNEQHDFVEELMRQMGMSKQKVLTFLLEEGVKVVKASIQADQDNSFLDSPFYLFNLSKSETLADENMMLTKQIIASKDESWRGFIKSISAKRTVFMYTESKGVIAYGKTSGKPSTMQEYTYQDLSNFQIIEHPVSVSEIRKILGVNLISSKMISPLVDGNKILNHITTVLHTCPKCGVQARGFNEIEELFGFRNMSNGISHQSWCRTCRRG